MPSRGSDHLQTVEKDVKIVLGRRVVTALSAYPSGSAHSPDPAGEQAG